MTAADSLPLAAEDWYAPAELSRRVRRAAYTIREHLRGERLPMLHGHYVSGRWQIKGAVGDAWRQGLDTDAQQRICGCPQVPSPRRARPT